MRAFWIVFVLVVAGLGVWFTLPAGSESGTTASPTASTRPNEARPTPPTPPIADQTGAIETADAAVDDADSADTPVTVEAPAETETIEDTTPDLAEADAPDADAITNSIAGGIDSGASGWESLTPVEDSASADADDAIEIRPDEAATVSADTVEMRELPDGTTLVNERFAIAGAGTKDDPYLIPWEYLVSAREGYDPRSGKKDIPAHLGMLADKYVAIAGYLQFPLATPEPTECLIMLNQWDGCCIGVPPTPYDAIEVTLANPATQAEKFAVEGRIVGKLKIDPYLVGDWLIGLYLMGDATLDISGARSVEEVYGAQLPQFQPGG